MLGVVAALVMVFLCVSAYADCGKCCAVKLPAVIKAAIELRCPGAKIEKMEMEKEGMKVYEVEVSQDGMETELTVAEDGTIVEEEKEIDVKSLPDAVKKALAGMKVEEAKQEVEYYAVVLTKLDTPIMAYKVEAEEGGKDLEITLSTDGKILKREVEEDEDNDREHKGKDKDDDEEELTFSQVPKAVIATILKECKDGDIKKVERDDESENVLYEAEIVIGGKEFELKISSDGKVVSKKVESKDNDDGDDDEEDDD